MPESLTFCGRTFGAGELELMRQTRAGVFRSRSDRDRAHRLRVAGVDTAQWRVEEPRVPATAGAAPGRRLPAASRGAKTGREGSATGGRIGGLLGTGAGRMRRQRLRASGTGPGGRPSREPPVARADGTVSLSRMPRAVRREPALLGTESGSGVGLSALDLARLEDAGAGRVDRLERRAAASATCNGS